LCAQGAGRQQERGDGEMYRPRARCRDHGTFNA
jgi:hypothetical protein